MWQSRFFRGWRVTLVRTSEGRRTQRGGERGEHRKACLVRESTGGYRRVAQVADLRLRSRSGLLCRWALPTLRHVAHWSRRLTHQPPGARSRRSAWRPVELLLARQHRFEYEYSGPCTL